MHFPVFSTDCATHASHLEITKCRWGILWPRARDGCSDAVTQGRTPLLSSHGSCKPIDEYPYCTEVAMQLMYVKIVIVHPIIPCPVGLQYIPLIIARMMQFTMSFCCVSVQISDW